MQEWMIFVRDVGFPIVVAMYLLHRIETRLDQAIVMLSLIARQTEKAYPDVKTEKSSYMGQTVFP